MTKIVVKCTAPVVFLDVDGVLSPTDHWHQLKKDKLSFFGNRISKSCMEQLKRIIDVCDARVVVSSTWRLYPDDMMELMEMLSLYSIPLIGTTPSLADRKRGKEIQAWIKEHAYDRQDFVILDDDTADIVCCPCLKEHLFHTNTVTGLTVEIATAAIKYLQRNKPQRRKSHVHTKELPATRIRDAE